MSLTTHFKLDVTFQKGQAKDSMFLCNVTLQCCTRKELEKEDVEDLILQRFEKKLKAEEDFTFKYTKVDHHDHAILHDDGYENVTITITKKDSPVNKKDGENQHESLRKIELMGTAAQA